ncbi:MAG: methyltransferase domain-containing protein [Betaproteobacteria bacterium]
MAWEPAQYLQFAGERLRPAIDLLVRVQLEHPRTIVDLGCGAGNVTRLLGERWPDARIVGVDSSPEMLDEARAATAGDPRYQFVAADLAAWEPDAPVDVVYSNAALHWLSDHDTLFPRVAKMVASGGVLAVQMPDSFRAPSHTAIEEIGMSERWRANLEPVLRGPSIASATEYLAWLLPLTSHVDMWFTEYMQILPARADGEHPVAAWTKGTRLVPILSALDEHERADFLGEYRQRLVVAYPPRADGSTLFPFRRLFIVANR